MKKMLIAEYTEALRVSLCDALRQKYQIAVCDNGETALSLLNSYHPDVLILDLALPELDGLTVLRQSQYLPPVIMCTTTFCSDQIVQSAFDLGVGYMFLKPCSLKAVLMRLDELVETSSKCKKPPPRP